MSHGGENGKSKVWNNMVDTSLKNAIITERGLIKSEDGRYVYWMFE